MSGNIGNDLGREEFGVLLDIVLPTKMKVLWVGIQPSAKRAGRNTYKRGKFGFGVKFHFGLRGVERFLVRCAHIGDALCVVCIVVLRTLLACVWV